MTIKSFFTPQEQKQILALRVSGYSIKRISNTIHRSRVNVGIFLNDPEQYRKLKVEAKAKNGQSTPSKTKKNPTKKDAVLKKTEPPKTPSKTPSKFSKSSGTSTQIANRDLADFNKVILEHRCVIKFLTKLGERASAIHQQLKKAYGAQHPKLPAIKYWAAQFRKGRQTILNDPKLVRKLTQAKKRKVSVTKTKVTSIKKVKKTASAVKKVKAAKKTPLQNGVDDDSDEEMHKEEEPVKKHDPKKSLETFGTFTIKLPGLDRITKSLAE